MRMKQAVSLLLGASLCLPLAGCGENTAPVEPAGTAQTTVSTGAVTVPETAAKDTVPVTQPVTVEVWEPADSDFVAVWDYIPDIQVELKYAAAENFTGQVIYDFSEAYLRYGTVKKLMAVQTELRSMGLGLKIWDGYRPRSAQIRLWEVFPDDTYVANPEIGNSNHSRGNAVDVTLVDLQGREQEMPSEFDDFSGKADREYSDCTDTAAWNSGLLQRAMEKHGFSGYSAEWWHYNDTVRYEVELEFDPAVVSRWYADCAEFLSLRASPEVTAQALARIPAGEEVTLLGFSGDFAMVDHQGRRGYVLADYLHPLGQTRFADCREFITLRESPSVTAQALARIPAGETVQWLGRRGEFSWVYYEGTLGYVLSGYLRTPGEAVYAQCEEFISLREAPSVTAGVLTRIPKGGEMTLLDYSGDFARVSYQGQEGYVLSDYIRPMN